MHNLQVGNLNPNSYSQPPHLRSLPWRWMSSPRIWTYDQLVNSRPLYHWALRNYWYTHSKVINFLQIFWRLVEIDLPIQSNFSHFLSKASERLTYPMHQEWNFRDPHSKASGLWRSNTVLHMVLCSMSNNLLCFVDLKLHLDSCCMNYILLYFCGSFDKEIQWKSKSSTWKGCMPNKKLCIPTNDDKIWMALKAKSRTDWTFTLPSSTLDPIHDMLIKKYVKT